MPRFRSTELADVPALATLGADTFTETFGHLYSDEDLQFYLHENFAHPTLHAHIHDVTQLNLVVEHDGELVAYLRAGKVLVPATKPPAGSLEVYKLYVRANRHGSGYGRELMEEAIAYAKKQNAPALYLSVWEENFKAQRFYQHYGFSRDGEYGYPVGKQLDRELIYRKNLA